MCPGRAPALSIRGFGAAPPASRKTPCTRSALIEPHRHATEHSLSCPLVGPRLHASARVSPLESPPTRRAPTARHLPTVVGLLVAIAAVGAYVYFFLLAKPAQRSAPKTVARLTALEGSVRVKAGEAGTWTAAAVGRELRTGDVVHTDPKAAAAITFLSGNIVRVRPDSVVLISEDAGTVAEEATAWHVQSGQVNFDLKRSTEIVTPTARTRASADS